MRDIRPGNKGQWSQSQSDMKSHKGGGTQYDVIFFVKWECYVNISKNNLREVKMVSEGSDTTP